MLHRYVCAGIVLLALGGSALAAPLKGRITSVSKDKVTIKVKGVSRTFNVKPATRFVVQTVSRSDSGLKDSSIESLQLAINDPRNPQGVLGFAELETSGLTTFVSTIRYISPAPLAIIGDGLKVVRGTITNVSKENLSIRVNDIERKTYKIAKNYKVKKVVKKRTRSTSRSKVASRRPTRSRHRPK